MSVRENTYTEQDYEQGFITGYANVRRNETSPLTYHKTLNYGDCILEKRRVKAEGIQEPVFLNTRGELSEGATTNVFFVKRGRFLPLLYPVVCFREFCGSICMNVMTFRKKLFYRKWCIPLTKCL